MPAYALGRRETPRWGRRRGRRTSDVVLWWGVLASAMLLVSAMPAYAGRPLAVDDAAPLEWGRMKVEVATALKTSEEAYDLAAPFNLALGVTPWLEVGMSPSVVYVNNPEASPRRAGGIGDLVLAAKAALPFEPFNLDLALVPSLKIPTADEGRGLGTGDVDRGVVLIVTKVFTELQKLHFNAGYTVVGKSRESRLRDVLFMGIAGETTLPGLAEQQLQFVAELFGTTPAEQDGSGDLQARLGMRYLLAAEWTLDAAVGRSLTAHPQVEFFATVGLTWTFKAPWHHRSKP